jgi:U3 small nucleolar RNA-associated protein 3
MYAVAPKYPGLDNEIEGERAVGNMIMKNRGLVAHKNRLNRNPRVKKREQYRKALIKRKGAVREVRTDEGHKYGGETTGVKSGISRSRKLGVK